MIEVSHKITEILQQYIQTGGWLLIPLILSAFGIWYTYFVLLIRLKRALNTADIDALGVESALKNEETSLIDTARRFPDDKGATPRLVRRVLERMNCGVPFRDAFFQCRDGELETYQYAFYIMGALVTAAPLMGLLGTVFGMIDTFMAFSEQAGAPQRTEQIAAGISTALITTQTGLVAALPGTIGLAHLYRLYQRLRNVVDRCESHLALALRNRK